MLTLNKTIWDRGTIYAGGPIHSKPSCGIPIRKPKPRPKPDEEFITKEEFQV